MSRNTSLEGARRLLIGPKLIGPNTAGEVRQEARRQDRARRVRTNATLTLPKLSFASGQLATLMRNSSIKACRRGYGRERAHGTVFASASRQLEWHRRRMQGCIRLAAVPRPHTDRRTVRVSSSAPRLPRPVRTGPRLSSDGRRFGVSRG